MTQKRSHAVPIKDGRFLIIGGASLVGSATAQHMLEAGAREVIIFDNFYQGSKHALQHIEQDTRLTILRGDVLRLPQLINATAGVDGVLQLAAVMTITMHEDPWTGLDVNIRGVQNVLEACTINHVRKLVFASSNAVYGYGPSIIGELKETTPFHSVGAPPAAILYGASKIIGEQLCRQAHQRANLDYIVLRYSTVYGERQHYRAANALYIIETYDALQRGEAPKIIGDGTESKHFVHVHDVARANLCAFTADTTDTSLNISGPEPVTTGKIVELVTTLSGRNIAPEYTTPDPGKVRLTSGGAWRLDHANAAAKIGWTPEISMQEGIKRLIDWLETQRPSE